MKRKRFAILIFLLPYIFLSAQNKPPAAQSGTFKFSDIRWRDMCVLPDPATKTYYIVGPGFRGVRAYTSRDLINWTGPHNGDTRPHLFEMEDTGETLKIVKEITVN